MAPHTVTGKLAYYSLMFYIHSVFASWESDLFFLIFLWSGQNSVLEGIFSFYKTAEIFSPKHARSSAKNTASVSFRVYVTLYVTVCQMVHPSVRPSVLQCKRLSHVCYSLCPPARDGCFVYGLVTVLPVKTDVRGGVKCSGRSGNLWARKVFFAPHPVCLNQPRLTVIWF